MRDDMRAAHPGQAAKLAGVSEHLRIILSPDEPLV
jgi:hypothetical protein